MDETHTHHIFLEEDPAPVRPVEPRRSWPRRALGFVTFAGLVGGAMLGGRRAVEQGKGVWYRRLRKPKANPPDWVFGPIWTALYALSALSGYRVWKKPSTPERARALALWGGQLVANGAWTWIFFGAHKKKAALADLGALCGLLAAYALTARRVDRPAAWMVAPVLAWTGFAGYLNAAIVEKNP